jgi:hypothetical protein
MVRALGRPPERDSEGNVVSKCLVNVTIPTKLRDFLAKNNINRSQLFTTIVKRMRKKEICPKCYEEHITRGIMAITCDDCDCVIEYNNCSVCDAKYQRATVIDNIPVKGNLPISIKGSGKFGCGVCQ